MRAVCLLAIKGASNQAIRVRCGKREIDSLTGFIALRPAV
jgi:hypothetical protein